MLQNKFNQAVFEALADEYEQSVPEFKPHEFSPEFEHKMQKLISRQNKPYYKIINTFGKRVACFLIGFMAISFTTVMSVDALRTPFLNFWVDIFETNSIVQTVDKSAPKTIESIYEITADLSNFTVDHEISNVYSHFIFYKNDNEVICFEQNVKEIYDVSWNTEGAEVETIFIDGAEGIYFCDIQDYHTIIWDNGDYIFSISTNISKDCLIELANSVQKVEE